MDKDEARWLDELLHGTAGTPSRGGTAASAGASSSSQTGGRRPAAASTSSARRTLGSASSSSSRTTALRTGAPASARGRALASAAAAASSSAASRRTRTPPMANQTRLEGAGQSHQGPRRRQVTAARHHGNAGTRPPVTTGAGLAPAAYTSAMPSRDTAAAAPADDTALDEQFARMLQQEMLAELERESQSSSYRANAFGSRPMSRKELDPDLYSPSFTSPAYASYAQEDNTLMEAYRDLNRQRGLDDSSDCDDDADDKHAGVSAAPPTELITISSSDEDNDDDEDEEKEYRRGKAETTGELLGLGDNDRDNDTDEFDDDTVDELDLGQLSSYPLKVLKQYCTLEGLAVRGRTKEDYVNAIVAYNDDMDEEEDDLSISDLVEQTRLDDDSLASSDAEEELSRGVPSGGPRPPPLNPRSLSGVVANQDKHSRKYIISEESDSDQEQEMREDDQDGSAVVPVNNVTPLPDYWDLTEREVQSRAPPPRATTAIDDDWPALAYGVPDLVDADNELPMAEASKQPSTSTLGRDQHYRSYGGGFYDSVDDAGSSGSLYSRRDDELSEEEMLQIALRESMLEQQKQPQPQPQPSGGAGVVPTANHDLQADEALARALQEELNSSMSDERLARQLQGDLQRERNAVAPMDDTTAILMDLADRSRQLRDQTDAARTLLATGEARRRREIQRQQLAAAVAAASEPTSYFRRNFSPTFAPPPAAAAANLDGADPPRHRHRHRRHNRGLWDDNDNSGGVDPDEMTYEQLLELQERIGEVKKKGASTSAISSNTQVYVYHKKPTASADSDSAKCSVCMDDFAEGDEVRMLPCIHAYHRACIDQWLVKKAACPVCQCPITGRPDPASSSSSDE